MRCGDDANDAEEGQLSHKMPAGGGGVAKGGRDAAFSYSLHFLGFRRFHVAPGEKQRKDHHERQPQMYLAAMEGTRCES